MCIIPVITSSVIFASFRTFEFRILLPLKTKIETCIHAGSFVMIDFGGVMPLLKSNHFVYKMHILLSIPDKPSYWGRFTTLR